MEVFKGHEQLLQLHHNCCCSCPRRDTYCASWAGDAYCQRSYLQDRRGRPTDVGAKSGSGSTLTADSLVFFTSIYDGHPWNTREGTPRRGLHGVRYVPRVSCVCGAFIRIHVRCFPFHVVHTRAQAGGAPPSAGHSVSVRVRKADDCRSLSGPTPRKPDTTSKRTFGSHAREKELVEGRWAQPNVEASAPPSSSFPFPPR